MSQPRPILSFIDRENLPGTDVPLMGNKGANLIAMVAAGLPVPPGFIVTTEVGKRVAAGQEAVGADLRAAMNEHLQALETVTDKVFGGADNPLLLSVRSGAAVSMPGMMDTVLNLGLSETAVHGLAKLTGDQRFAWDTYRRFIQSFAHVVLDVDAFIFDDLLDEARLSAGVEQDSQLSIEALRSLSSEFLVVVKRETGADFPQDPSKQLELALLAVFQSWNTNRARQFRQMQGIEHDDGSAAVVQAMVFGNRDEDSCSGVYFTRNPATGEPAPFGEYLINAQGEDVVSGIRTPNPLTKTQEGEGTSLEEAMPKAFCALVETGENVEKHFSEVQEIEFTVESGNLFLLQTRTGKVSAKASLRIAVDMVEEGLLTRSQALQRCNPQDFASQLARRVCPNEEAVPWARGMAASPGAVIGKIALTADAALSAKAQDKATILVRPETNPNDIKGMDAAAGILTSRGGATSHAAVVAQAMGKPCITGASSVKIDLANGLCSSQGQVLREGDTVTMDGATGLVFKGEQPLMEPEASPYLKTLMGWAMQN
ncbi:MAG: pyruvate, phosphate dikinase [Pseudomonadota bacterium]